MSLISLELETDQILIAAARPVGKLIEIQDAFSIGLTGETDLAIAESLKTALAKHGLSRSDAIVVVNRTSVEIRELAVPPAPDNELPDMVRLIARNEFASLNDNWLLDFVPLSTDPNSPRKVLATGLSPERHQQIAKIAEAAGLKIKHIVLRPFAVFDLLRPSLSADSARLIVDQYGQQVDMIVSLGSQVVATRTLRLLAHDDREQAFKNLVSEMKRTIASSRSTVGERDISEIIVTSATEQDEDYRSKLQKQLACDVRLINPFSLADQADRLKLPDESTHYSALLGSLLQQSSGTRHAIDFLNPRRPVVKKNDLSRTYLYGGIAAAVTLLAMIVGWWTLSSQSTEMADLESRLQMAVMKNKGNQNEPGVEQVIGEVSKIDEWKQQDIDWLEELYKYSDLFLTPDDAIVDSMDAGSRRDGPQIVIRSHMAGFEKEAAVIKSLESRPYQVNQSKSGDSSEDESYPISADFNVVLSADRSGVVQEIDAKATEFLKQRNSQPK